MVFEGDSASNKWKIYVDQSYEPFTSNGIVPDRLGCIIGHGFFPGRPVKYRAQAAVLSYIYQRCSVLDCIFTIPFEINEIAPDYIIYVVFLKS